MPDLSRSTVSFASTDTQERARRSSSSLTEDVPHRYTRPPRRQNSGRSDGAGYTDEAISGVATERTSLLHSRRSSRRRYTDSKLSSPRASRQSKGFSSPIGYRLSRVSSRQSAAVSFSRRPGLRTPKILKIDTPAEGPPQPEDLLWYDQFTSTDWVRDSISDGHRVLQMRQKKGIRGRLALAWDAAQGWILIILIGALTAAFAYLVDVAEAPMYDWKRGYCTRAWYYDQASCCGGRHHCQKWVWWSDVLKVPTSSRVVVNWLAFITGCLVCAAASCFLTLQTKTIVPSNIATTFDENLGAEGLLIPSKLALRSEFGSPNSSPNTPQPLPILPPPMIYYSAAGSGVAEVKVILSGFVLHGYLGIRTFVIKTAALVLAVASGMSLGKEGPYVHIATCIGNVACRIFDKYSLNDAKRREILSASAACGVAVAFGSPLGGVLFSLEEVSYYFPPKTLFRTFVCCIVAALSLKFWNPYGTNKIVLFEVRYITDWGWFELLCFSLVGVLGGVLGALFIKASRFWATTFRRTPAIKNYPMLEVLLVALITGLASYWNRFANLAVTELLLELASPCGHNDKTGLCPTVITEIPPMIQYLLVAFLIKAILTIVTFGIKVPAGIYVPSMVVGGIMGRIIGHGLQYVAHNLHSSWFFGHCPATGNFEECITPGVYALVAAGATLCGVTRLSVTLAVILFELTGSLDHVVPFSLGILFARLTADFIEPYSVYDLLINMNSYPYMDNRTTPIFNANLGEITPRARSNRVIDITISPLVHASDLRSKLALLQSIGELDGGLPIIRDKLLVGLIPAPDLEFALDKISSPEAATLCLMSDSAYTSSHHRNIWLGLHNTQRADDSSSDTDSVAAAEPEPVEHADFTPFVDPAPVALDVRSPMDLVYQCFVKLGLRYICVLEDGEYKGMVHKKLFVKYVKDNELEITGH